MSLEMTLKMEVSENSVFYGFFVSLFLYYFWDVYLSFRQLKTYFATTEVPPEFVGIFPQPTFEKARQYAIHKRLFKIFEGIYDCALSLIFLSIEFMPFLWDFSGKTIMLFGFEPVEFVQGLIFILVLNTLHSVIHIPHGIYYHFVIEEKHGFNNQTFLFYVFQRIRRYLLEQVLTIPIMCGIAFVIDIGGKFLFLYAWLFMLLATAFAYYMYFDVIIPTRDKLVPLPDGELKNEIDKLTTSVGYPSCKVYVAKRSAKSHHSNAYFMGLFYKKRIVIFDTLLKDLESIDDKYENEKKGRDEEEKEKRKRIENKNENEKGKENENEEVNEKEMNERKALEINEILAILSHELGHWKCNHLLKRVSFLLGNLLLLFFMISLLFHYRVFYVAFGFNDSMPVVVGLIVVLQLAFLPFYEIISLSLAYMGRQFEFQSDRFAKSLGKSHHLKRALIKIHMNNLGFPVHDPLYSAFRLNHPPLLERIRALDKDD